MRGRSIHVAFGPPCRALDPTKPFRQFLWASILVSEVFLFELNHGVQGPPKMHDSLICRAIYQHGRIVRHKVEALVDYELFSEIREIERDKRSRRGSKTERAKRTEQINITTT